MKSELGRAEMITSMRLRAAPRDRSCFRAVLTVGVVSFIPFVILGCSGSERTAESADDRILIWEGPLVLEENDSIFVAEPVISPDRAGGLIVSDRQQQQVRLHSADGKLSAFFGRRGPGPQEFENLVDAARSADGRLFVLDRNGELSSWTAAGDSLLDVLPSPSRSSDITAFGDYPVIVATPPTGPENLSISILHLLRPDGSILKELVKPHVTEASVFALFTVEAPSVEGLGDLKGVTIPIADTIWVVDAATASVSSKLKIPSSRLAERLPPVDPLDDRAGFFEWLQNTWFVRAAHPIEEGGWLVALWHAASEGSDWALVRLDSEGELEWEIGGVPALMTIDADGRLIFDDPESLLPNHLQVARLGSNR